MDYKVNILSIEPINNGFKFRVCVSSVFVASDNKEYCRSFKEQAKVEDTLKKWFGNIKRDWPTQFNNNVPCWCYLCERA